PAGLARALGAEPQWVGRSRFAAVALLEDERAVRELRPDIAALRQVDARGIIVTAPAAAPDAGDAFVGRFFGPRVGVAEDPVTGSAHCALGPFWAQRLGKDELVGYQASARGGRVRVRTRGERVLLGGQAVTVLRGELVG